MATGPAQLLGGFSAVKGILQLLLVYNLTCVVVFATAYYSIGFGKNFNLPETMDDTYINCLYYAFAVQATCMAGEVYPKTRLGRGILAMQILSAFMATMVLLVPWVHISLKHSK
jgi:hypothetical protein